MKENRPAAVPFILVTVFLDVMGIAIVIPVLPGLIATFTADRDAQTYWYGAMLASYGLMQFVSAPILGALSDLNVDLGLSRLCLRVIELRDKRRLVSPLSPCFCKVCTDRARRPPDLVRQCITLFAWKILSQFEDAHH